MLKAAEHFSASGMGGALSWDQFERLAPESSARWDVDGMEDWQNGREGPYLHVNWDDANAGDRSSLLAVVFNPKNNEYTAARWDGPKLGWKKDAASGNLHDVMRLEALSPRANVLEPAVDPSDYDWRRSHTGRRDSEQVTAARKAAWEEWNSRSVEGTK